MSSDQIKLGVGAAELTVDAGNGCRISSLVIDGTEVLRQGDKYGCFPMVPWCGRVENGQFRDGGVKYQLPLNSPPHAIHGTARDHAWKTARVSGTEAVFTYELAEPWPFSGKVTQIFELTPDALTVRMGVETYDNSFPAQVGWHPWFQREIDGSRVGLAFDPAWQEERGEDHLPTGRRIDPLPGPWDDCFGMPDGVDVTLTWPGLLELKVTSPTEWVVVYDEQAEAVCVEPQSGPPNGLNTLPRLVTPIEPLELATTWSWRRL
ncbi:aldose 1-epimerase [Streptomyces xanthochromogenes]|uniref:aldose epimerase family protein n=1 Tax=Streptomyces xanthochromogenes TaxID=67384 RepID=UPI001672CB5E|nr:aldose 1-epimerase [Streptomyces xanthochromogenes]GHB77327.1 aldose 1-epimerase [Streptomyces xanthochromogenes]